MAEAVYQGVCAGIGDRANNINVIEPWFDATIRKFIIGQDGIIDGLRISANMLKKGMCVVEGYVGYIDQDIPVPDNYVVYAKFEINHDKDIPDKFSIIVTQETYLRQDDILHEAGEYYILMADIAIPRLDYPANAYHADNASIVHAVPVDGTNLEDGVTAVTQEVGNNSKKVATTEFVQKQIEKDITQYLNRGNYNDTVTKTWKYGSSTYEFNITYSIRRLVNICVLSMDVDGFSVTANNISAFVVKDGYRPQQDTILYNHLYSTNGTSSTITIKTNGEIIFNGDFSIQRTGGRLHYKFYYNI